MSSVSPEPRSVGRLQRRVTRGLPGAQHTLACASVTAAAVVFLSGCSKATSEQVADGDDPLAALAVSAETHRYTEPYWIEQFHADSAGRPSPWKQALAYCGTSDAPRPGLNAHGNKPNCGAVFQVEQHTPTATARYQARQKAALEQLRQRFDSQLREAQARAGRF